MRFLIISLMLFLTQFVFAQEISIDLAEKIAKVECKLNYGDFPVFDKQVYLDIDNKPSVYVIVFSKTSKFDNKEELLRHIEKYYEQKIIALSAFKAGKISIREYQKNTRNASYNIGLKDDFVSIYVSATKNRSVIPEERNGLPEHFTECYKLKTLFLNYQNEEVKKEVFYYLGPLKVFMTDSINPSIYLNPYLSKVISREEFRNLKTYNEYANSSPQNIERLAEQWDKVLSYIKKDPNFLNKVQADEKILNSVPDFRQDEWLHLFPKEGSCGVMASGSLFGYYDGFGNNNKGYWNLTDFAYQLPDSTYPQGGFFEYPGFPTKGKNQGLGGVDSMLNAVAYAIDYDFENGGVYNYKLDTGIPKFANNSEYGNNLNFTCDWDPVIPAAYSTIIEHIDNNRPIILLTNAYEWYSNPGPYSEKGNHYVIIVGYNKNMGVDYSEGIYVYLNGGGVLGPIKWDYADLGGRQTFEVYPGGDTGEFLSAPELLNPKNNELVDNNEIYFEWSEVPSASQYLFQTAKDSNFTIELNSYYLSTNNITLSFQEKQYQEYYWHVAVKNINDNWCEFSDISCFIVTHELTIDHYLDKSTYYPNESGLYTVVLKDENGNPASGYSVEYVVETEWGSAIQTGECPETSTTGTYESVGFYGPSDVGNYTIHANISFEGESIAQSDKINFSVIEKGKNTLSLVANPNPCDKYSTTALTATYLDAEGNPLEGEQIEFTSYIDGSMDGGDVAPNIATTDANGKASVNFTPEGESGNIKANSVNNSDIEDIIELQVSSGELRVEIQVNAEEIGETVSYYDLDIRAYNQDDELVQDAVINSVTTTLGTVDSYSPTTGGYGIGDADISTTESGESIITVDVEGSIGQTSTYFQVGTSDALEPVIEIVPNNMVQVNGIDWSSDDQKFLIAMEDNSSEGGRIDVYDTNNWELINSIASNDGESYGAAFSSDVTKVVGSHNGAFTTHNTNDGSVIRTTRDPDGNDESRFTFWNNSDKIISIGHKDGYDRSVALVLRGSDLSVLHVLTDGSSSPDQMDYCQSTDKIAVADGDYVYCYNGSSYSIEKTFELKDVSACFNGSGSRLAISRDNDYIRIFNYNNSSSITDITGSWNDEFKDMDWTQDNEYLAGYNKDREVYIFDYDPSNDTGHELYKMSIGGASDGTLKWNPSSNLLGVENEQKVLIYSPTDIIDPQLSVEYPIDTLYTYESSITTTGNTNDENGIKLLKIITPTTTHEITDLPDGNFSQLIDLSEGENLIQYISYDNNWNSTEIDRVIIRNTDQSGPTISEVSFNKDEIEVSETGLLTAKIIDDVSGILNGSTKCIMHNTDSTVVYSLLLYDDGTHGDSAPNDNYFSCIIDPTDLGISILDVTYYFDIEAKDNSASQNQSYKNNADNSFIYDNPVISDMEVNPEAPTSDDSLTVSCLITDFSEISTATFYLKNIDNDNYVPYGLFNVSATDTFKNTIEPQVAGQYKYFIKGVDEYGKYSYSDTLLLTIDQASSITTDWQREIPKVYSLYQSFPNPFNPTTTIRYDLPKATRVVITIYNSLGQKVKTLIKKNDLAGHHSITFDGSALSSGVYFYKIQAGSFVKVKKMLLLK